MQNNKYFIQPNQIKKLLPYSDGVTTVGSSTCLIWQVLYSGGFPDAIPKGFVSLPRFKPGIFCLLGKCVDHCGNKNIKVYNLLKLCRQQGDFNSLIGSPPEVLHLMRGSVLEKKVSMISK